MYASNNGIQSLLLWLGDHWWITADANVLCLGLKLIYCCKCFWMMWFQSIYMSEYKKVTWYGGRSCTSILVSLMEKWQMWVLFVDSNMLCTQENKCVSSLICCVVQRHGWAQIKFSVSGMKLSRLSFPHSQDCHIWVWKQWEISGNGACIDQLAGSHQISKIKLGRPSRKSRVDMQRKAMSNYLF